MDFLSGKVRLHAGDCLDVVRTLPDASIDSVVTDPPLAADLGLPHNHYAVLMRWTGEGEPP